MSLLHVNPVYMFMPLPYNSRNDVLDMVSALRPKLDERFQDHQALVDPREWYRTYFLRIRIRGKKKIYMRLKLYKACELISHGHIPL